ncbi:hypothetical protein Gohar_012707, partial [Gossypium harknessii]|nr:hypothetical protein [Gossypium harknessii]
VKALYVKNIPDNTSTEKLKEVFQRHGEVTKVVMPPGKAGKRDFGFIHYAERSSALKAVKDTEKYEIDGQVLEVVLAKPQADKKTDAAYPYIAGLNPNHLQHPGYGGFTGTTYGSPSAGFGAATSFQQVLRLISSNIWKRANANKYGHGAHGSTRWPNRIRPVTNSQECRCQPHVLEELIGAMAREEEQGEVEIVEALKATAVEGTDPISLWECGHQVALLLGNRRQML